MSGQPYCPGCSHGLVNAALLRALQSLELQPNQVAVVTDIGCVGLADAALPTNTYHGLHGRAVTYAQGLKLARPELTVIALIGDGGCGIGGHHLIAAARRNVDVTVVVYDNFNYGMTGGEHSATTPACGLTSDTPQGAPEAPMDVCATVLANGAPFAARASALEPGLDAVLARAIAHRGFALVDVWELCTAYYATANALSRAGLAALSQRLGMPFGVLRDAPRPDYAQAPRPPVPPQRKGALSPAFAHGMPEGGRVELVLGGSAGQKVRSSASAFASGAILAGLWVCQKDDFPITVKTGHSVSELVLAERPAGYTGVEDPSVIVVLSADGAARLERRIARLPASAWVYACEGVALPQTRATVIRLPLPGSATPPKFWALAALSRVLSAFGWFPVGALRAAAGRLPETLRAEQAIEQGCAL